MDSMTKLRSLTKQAQSNIDQTNKNLSQTFPEYMELELRKRNFQRLTPLQANRLTSRGEVSELYTWDFRIQIWHHLRSYCLHLLRADLPQVTEAQKESFERVVLAKDDEVCLELRRDRDEEMSRKYEGDYLFSIVVNGKKVPVYTEDVCLTRDDTKLIIGLSEGTRKAIAAARKRIVIDKSGGE